MVEPFFSAFLGFSEEALGRLLKQLVRYLAPLEYKAFLSVFKDNLLYDIVEDVHLRLAPFLSNLFIIIQKIPNVVFQESNGLSNKDAVKEIVVCRGLS